MSQSISLSLYQLMGLIAFPVAMATGQVLFKLGATRVPEVHGLSGWLTLLLQPVVIFALILYAASTLLWLWLLQRIPLTTAYPFSALAFFLVPLGGWFIFKEPLNLRYMCGVGLILLGVLLTSSSR